MSNQNSSSEYEFGKCRLCNKDTVLYKGLCVDCQNTDVPDFLKELLNPKDNNGKQ
jgi:hypothetical protein